MIDEKILESFEVSDWEIETEDGWKDITYSNKTKKFVVWKLNTESFELKCADDHIVMDEYFNQIFVKDLRIGQRLITKNGLEKVISVECLNFEEEMYDLSVDSENHTYFTSGILSHNTTVASVYLVYYAIFNGYKNIAVLANKQETAIEIMSRIQMIIEGLPLWLSPEILEWSKKKILFGNGSKIEAFASSSTAIRGKSTHILFLDEFAFILPNVCKEFMDAVYPTITANKNSKIIMVSTPNGMNQFYEIWSAAVKGKSQFFPIKVHWWEHPDRDETFKQNMIRDRGVQFFLGEFQCSEKNSKITVKNEAGLIENVTVEELYKYGKSIFN